MKQQTSTMVGAEMAGVRWLHGGRSCSQIQIGQLGFDFLQAAFDQLAFRGAEAVKRFGHEIVADAQAGQRAFDAFDDRGGIFADAIKRIADALDLLLQFLRAGEISGAMRFDQFDVEFGKQIRAAAHAAVAAELQRCRTIFPPGR